jgi:hypothetical protein
VRLLGIKDDVIAATGRQTEPSREFHRLVNAEYEHSRGLLAAIAGKPFDVNRCAAPHGVSGR